MKLILGSHSPSRRMLLERAGFAFECLSPNIDEKAIRDTDPIKLTHALAHAKADALLMRVEEASLIITSDQVVACNGSILEKPTNAIEARAFLEGYALHPAEVVTTVVVTNTTTKQRQAGTDIARAWFFPIEPAVIEALLLDPKTYAYAGGFSIEDPRLAPFIQKVEGTTDSIMGLPLALTKELLEKASH